MCYDVIRCGTYVWHDMVWCGGVILYGMMWCGMLRYGIWRVVC